MKLLTHELFNKNLSLKKQLEEKDNQINNLENLINNMCNNCKNLNKTDIILRSDKENEKNNINDFKLYENRDQNKNINKINDDLTDLTKELKSNILLKMLENKQNINNLLYKYIKEKNRKLEYLGKKRRKFIYGDELKKIDQENFIDSTFDEKFFMINGVRYYRSNINLNNEDKITNNNFYNKNKSNKFKSTENSLNNRIIHSKKRKKRLEKEKIFNSLKLNNKNLNSFFIRDYLSLAKDRNNSLDNKFSILNTENKIDYNNKNEYNLYNEKKNEQIRLNK